MEEVMPRPRSVTDHTNQRNTKLLCNPIENILKAYGAAAVAAGVSMLALIQPCDAEVVYTPTDIKILGIPLLDLNNDGIVDFFFHNSARTGYRYATSLLTLFPDPDHKHNRIAATSVFGDAAALHRGDRIGPSSLFSMSRYSGGRVLAICYPAGGCAPGFGYGPFAKAGHGYVGLEFSINGQNHFGWVRVNLPAGPDSAVITGYAYETIPNKPIRAGQTSGNEATTGTLDPSAFIEPATLGRLAQGASGITAWRKR
jgi:hypothetical protein